MEEAHSTQLAPGRPVHLVYCNAIMSSVANEHKPLRRMHRNATACIQELRVRLGNRADRLAHHQGWLIFCLATDNVGSSFDIECKHCDRTTELVHHISSIYSAIELNVPWSMGPLACDAAFEPHRVFQRSILWVVDVLMYTVLTQVRHVCDPTEHRVQYNSMPMRLGLAPLLGRRIVHVVFPGCASFVRINLLNALLGPSKFAQGGNAGIFTDRHDAHGGVPIIN